MKFKKIINTPSSRLWKGKLVDVEKKRKKFGMSLQKVFFFQVSEKTYQKSIFL